MIYSGSERRLHMRHRAKTRVRVAAPGKSKTCRCLNLGANGCLIETGDLGLAKGMRATLTFVIDLGCVVKLHVRTAIVAHVTAGCTGFSMEQYAKRT